MHKITKEFGLDYGHRVHNQTLNKEYSIDDCLVCRHLHGHRMTVFVTLEAEELTDGMVTDFKHLNWFKQWLDDVVDHKFLIDVNDPMFERITHRTSNDIISARQSTHGYFALGGDSSENEILESFVVVNFVPTSENISKWLFGIVQARMEPLGVKVAEIKMMETPKSQAVYSE